MSIERRDLLPGPSATQWSGIALWGGGAWIVGTIGGAICAATIVRQSGNIDPVTFAFMLLFAGGLAVLTFGVWMMNRKAKREVDAGYTTMAQGYYNVERRHSPTGVIMRAAGEPALTREQWERAMQSVRAYKESQKH